MTLPVLGAAIAVGDISGLRDWLLEAPRPVEIQDFIFSGVLDGDWKALADIALKKLDGHEGPLGIHGPFWDLPLQATDPLIREVVRKRFAQGLEVCAHLGADLMVVHSPFTDWHEQNGFMFGGDADVIDNALETMAPVADRARALGVTLAVENIEERFPERRLGLVQALGRDVAGVSLDTGHAHYAHVSKGGRPVDAHAKTAAEALVHVHLQDADGYADRHWAPGLGNVPWKPLFATLAESCPNARLILELRDHGTIRQGAQHLVDLGLAV
ncbi:MAG: sugar phosphate isomerase/epimerase family protein [Pseudomonadota bacterium]